MADYARTGSKLGPKIAKGLAGALLLLCVHSSGWADYREVDIDLENRSFLKGLPFDVPFRLKGTVPSSISAVEVRYKIRCGDTDFPACDKIKGYYFPGSVSLLEPPAKWQRLSIAAPAELQKGERAFAVLVGPLHPNIRYEFELRLIVRPLSGAEAETARQALRKVALDGFSAIMDDSVNPGIVTEDELQSLEDKINGWAREQLRGQSLELLPFLHEDSSEDGRGWTVKMIDLDDPPAKDFIDAVENFDDERVAATTDVQEHRNNLRNALCVSSEKPCLRSEIERLLKAQLESGRQQPFGSESIQTEGGPVRPTVLAAVIIGLLKKPEDLAAVLELRKKIVGDQLVDAEPASSNLTSLEALKALFERAADPVNAAPDVPVPIKLRADVIDSLDVLIRRSKDLEAAEKSFEDRLKVAFPALLRAIERLEIFLEGTADQVKENKHAYISMDLGFGLVPEVDEGIFYAGTNFYAIPVNQETPLGIFRGSDRLLKRLSLLVGVTTSGLEGGRFQKFSNFGNPVLGAGIRLTRVVKLNGGVVFFKQKDANPIVSDTHNKRLGFVSLSLDVDLRGFLGRIAQFFPNT